MLGILNDIPSVKIDGDTYRYKLNKSHGLRTHEAHTQYIPIFGNTKWAGNVLQRSIFPNCKIHKKQNFIIDSILCLALSLQYTITVCLIFVIEFSSHLLLF